VCACVLLSDGDWHLLLISQRTEIGRVPDIDEPVYVISRIVLLPLNQTSAKDLDIVVCYVVIALALKYFSNDWYKERTIPYDAQIFCVCTVIGGYPA